MATLSQCNSFTSGELGDYTLRFAQAGLIALAVANGPALVAVPGAKGKTYSTNPLSFFRALSRRHPADVRPGVQCRGIREYRPRRFDGQRHP
nr:hypothetical protein GCM10020185_64470 [Pseudomonas brassicacearum subsp. brassicacearum]